MNCLVVKPAIDTQISVRNG